MNWIPRNKKTGIDYPPISDAEKAAMESNFVTKGKYTFRADGSAVPKVAAKPMPEKEKLMPVGVDIPDEPKQA